MPGAPVGAQEAGRGSTLAGHNPANGVPTQVDAALYQSAAYDLHELVGQYGNEQMPIARLKRDGVHTPSERLVCVGMPGIASNVIYSLQAS